MNTPPTEKTRRKVVLIMRCVLWPVWGLLLLFPLLFACTIALIFSNPTPAAEPADPHGITVLAIVDIMGGASSIVLMHVGRLVTMHILMNRGAWRGIAITYPIFKFLCWATCIGNVYFSLVICLIARSFWPGLAIAVPVWFLVAMDVPLMHPLSKVERMLAVHA